MRRRGIIFLGMILIGAELAEPALAQIPTRRPVPLLVQRDVDKRTLLRGDLAGKSVTVLYQTPLDVVSRVRVAPQGSLTAAIETKVDLDYSEVPRNQLVVLDATGKVVHRVERDVQTYVFSPDGRQLAYVVGRWYEAGIGFLPEALFVLDLQTWQERQIPEVTDPYELNWLQTEDEDALFARTLGPVPKKHVMRYDLKRRRAQVEPNGAFHISPDGRYVLKRDDELMAEGRCQAEQARCVEVTERRSGRALELPDQARNTDARVDWVYGRGHLLLVSRQQREEETVNEQRGTRTLEMHRFGKLRSVENTVLDVATGRTVETPRGVPMLESLHGDGAGWITSPRQLLLRPVDAPETSDRQRVLPQGLELRVLDRQRLETRRLDPSRLETRQPTTRRPVTTPTRDRDGGGD